MAEVKTILLPDVGDFDEIEVIEILINVGDRIKAEDSIVTLESDKATMEIPSPQAGIIKSIKISVGDKISKGSEIAEIEVSGAVEPHVNPAESSSVDLKDPEESAELSALLEQTELPGAAAEVVSGSSGKAKKPHPGVASGSADSSNYIHASPSIRRYARELGVGLADVIGSGPKGRILKEDVKAYVKSAITQSSSTTNPSVTTPAVPIIDFSRFGEIESQPLSRIKKISGAHLHRSWISVPHVTQFDEADITELEVFRKSLGKEAEQSNIRLTVLVFLMKAVVSALKEFPEFNSSLDPSGEVLILKKYFHIGVAVDTPNGLMVPVIRDVDQKGLFELAGEVAGAAERARNGKLTPNDMQGGCFSISSLGGIGGTQFTPIVNAPEVAILGVARSKMQPVYRDEDNFDWRLMLPMALSYDHRVIDGASGARFT
ncbi:MAG: pyruvate dehydrogenase E2 component (dihydrolipoamide acetyltransferase), partial [Gammaproteobacteria bacterium]